MQAPRHSFQSCHETCCQPQSYLEHSADAPRYGGEARRPGVGGGLDALIAGQWLEKESGVRESPVIPPPFRGQNFPAQQGKCSPFLFVCNPIFDRKAL